LEAFSLARDVLGGQNLMLLDRVWKARVKVFPARGVLGLRFEAPGSL